MKEYCILFKPLERCEWLKCVKLGNWYNFREKGISHKRGRLNFYAFQIPCFILYIPLYIRCVTAMNWWFREFNFKELGAEIISFQSFWNRKKKLCPQAPSKYKLGIDPEPLVNSSVDAVQFLLARSSQIARKLFANCLREVLPSVNLT